jgi:hypothetical protein
MFKQRGRFSSLPTDSKGAVSEGMNPSELWGVAQRDLFRPRRKRSAEAAKRRRARRSAKKLGIPLKQFLRRQANKGTR